MADETSDLPEVAHQPSLPSLELPEYHGRKPVGMKTSVNGAGNRINRPSSIGDRTIAVVELKTKKAGHEDTDDGLLYVENRKVVDFFEVAGDPGRRLLSAMRQAYRSADDVANGRAPLSEDLGTAGVTDASGVALTPAELAALHGHDPVRAMVDDDRTPVVVVYSDGKRELWPDDFDPGADRPAAGEQFETAADDPLATVHVRELLHAETGETIAEWTDEEENARLLELEQRLAAEEAEAEDPPGADEEAPDDEPGPFDDEGPASVTFEGDAPDEEIEFVEDEDGYAEPVADQVRDEEVPDNVTPIRTPGAELAEELHEPHADDFLFVDRKIPEIVEDLATLEDADHLRRLLVAEERGRGRDLKPRKGVLEKIEKRLAEVFSDPDAIPAPDLPDDPEGFAPDESVEEWDDTAEPEEV